MAATPDRILRTLVFPIQYLEIGEALARELGQDIDDLYRACGIDLPRPFMPWHTMNGLQMKRSLEHFLSVCPPGEPPVVPFMAHFPLTTHGPVGMLAMTDEAGADAKVLAELLAEQGLAAARLEQSYSQAVQERYEAYTQQAIDAGVFGAPTYCIDGELFWGQDRLDFVERKLRSV